MLAAGDTRTCVNKLTIDGPAPIVPRLPDGLDFVRRECRVVSSGNSVTGCSVSSWSAHRVQRVARAGRRLTTSPTPFTATTLSRSKRTWRTTSAPARRASSRDRRPASRSSRRSASACGSKLSRPRPAPAGRPHRARRQPEGPPRAAPAGLAELPCSGGRSTAPGASRKVPPPPAPAPGGPPRAAPAGVSRSSVLRPAARRDRADARSG